MIIIGADYHPGFQQIAYVDTDTGEFQERRLEHREAAEKFYRADCRPDLGAERRNWARFEPPDSRIGLRSKYEVVKVENGLPH
jgi:hypothetical protein